MKRNGDRSSSPRPTVPEEWEKKPLAGAGTRFAREVARSPGFISTT
jgi:hypothetical protein